MKCGWLKKQGGMVKTWHRRWFCLNGDCLFYFSKEDDLKPLGSIFLPGNRVSEIPFNPEDPEKFLFEVYPGKMQSKMTPNHDSFLLWAATDLERQNWIKIIRKVMFSSFGGAIFGQSIEETMEYERRNGRKIPYVVEKCIEFLEIYGLDTEGIFRLPGRSLLIKELKDKLDCAEKVVFDISQVDVHTVASLLKLYFRELPQSVVPANYYQKFMNIALQFQGARDENDRQQAVVELKEFLRKIPEDNFNILSYLCKFLWDVSEHSAENKMNILNLATVFGPNMVRNVSEADSAELMMATADITQQLAYMMIFYNKEVFEKEVKPSDAEDGSSKGEVPVDDLLGIGSGDDAFNDDVLMPARIGSSLMDQVTRELQGINFNGDGSFSPTDENVVTLRNSTHREGSSKEGSPVQDVRPARPVPPERKTRMNKIMRNKRSGSAKNRELILSSTSSTTSEDSTNYTTVQEEHRKMHYLETNFDENSVNGNNEKNDNENSVPKRTETAEQWLERELNETKDRYEKEIARLNEKLEQQNKTSQTRFSEMKAKYDRQVKELNKNMSVITSRYESRIASIDAVHKDSIRKLEEKLDAEQKSREDAVKRVINLQAELQRYHLQYGDINMK
ncbi:hypothetical protein FSP39_014593 [Pinctada imbricata]|uniref:Rho GTPase-activating protein 24 n=1 Tax=Pinctada imbricata TaxID=66713 RepID=A0AA88XS90_PINIB|nr:hypothetical protein FSP39_014593 [Pinctada imbricata]